MGLPSASPYAVAGGRSGTTGFSESASSYTANHVPSMEQIRPYPNGIGAFRRPALPGLGGYVQNHLPPADDFLRLETSDCSVRSLMLQHHPKCPPQEHDIQPDAPVADVPGVHLDSFFVGGVAAAVHLPHVGDTGMNHVEVLDVGAVFGDFGGDDGTGSHQAHLADEHVEQLGQFVQAGFPQYLPHPGHPGIVLQFEYGAQEHHSDSGEHQVEDPFDEPVVGPGQVVLQAHEHQPFVEQGIHFDAVHRETDQVGHKGQVPHMGLDGVDQAVQLVWRQAGGGDAHVLDLGLIDHFHHLAEGAQVGQVPHVFFLRACVVHIADDVEVQPHIVPDALEHQVGGLPGPHQEHRHAAHSGPVQDMGEEIPGQDHQHNGEDPQQPHKEPGGATSNMRHIYKNNNCSSCIGTTSENTFQ